MIQMAQALFISRKDIESYYRKPPLLTWGLFFPAVLMLAIYVKDPTGYFDVAPGIIAMALLFGNTSMAAVAITFEKRCGTLQRLLLTPVTHRTIIAGKALGGALYGVASSLVLTLALVWILKMPVVHPASVVAALLLGAGIFSLMGVIAAAMVREVFEAMTLMNYFRFPLLFVSGVFMPVESLPSWLKPLSLISPLTHVVELLRFGIQGKTSFPSPWVPALAALGFLIVFWLAAGPIFKRGATQ